jgi:hypothetical protein
MLTLHPPPLHIYSPSHFPFPYLMFEVKAFGHETQHLTSTVFQAQKTTLMMPPRRVIHVSYDRETKLHHYHPPKSCQILLKDKRLKPSSKSKRLSCSTQSMSSAPPPGLQAHARMPEALHTSHLSECLRQFKLCKTT